MSPINVLSLFDGMSCLQIALERAGIPVEWYYASEIHEPAIEVTMKNYPNTVQLGDVRELHADGLPRIDLLAGGSPCQNLSMAVIERKEFNQGLEGKKSKLFYEFVRLLQEIKPKYFLLENVASMKNEDRDIISEVLGVEPIMIDSKCVSAQQRPRYYWTNIPVSSDIDDLGIKLGDILQPADDIPEKEWYRDKKIENFDDGKNIIGTLPFNSHEMSKRVYNPNGKCGTLTCINGGYQEKKVWQDGCARKISPVEYERLQTVPDGYTEGFRDNVRRSMLGNGWTVDVIVHILNGMKEI
jgi:DNA (cytosine-5)-methyltransferase 3A